MSSNFQTSSDTVKWEILKLLNSSIKNIHKNIEIFMKQLKLLENFRESKKLQSKKMQKYSWKFGDFNRKVNEKFPRIIFLFINEKFSRKTT